MLRELKTRVRDANLKLAEYRLVVFTWGNVSGIDRDRGLVGIKPSGIEYGDLVPENMAVVELETGRALEGSRKPSSDTDTHLELYRHFPNIGGIVHTHSKWATTFAQSGLGIPVLGTTQADYFHGEVPCTREMTDTEIRGSYERETGRVIVEAFEGRDPDEVPAVIVRSHGPFVWGTSPENAVHNAVVLEECAEMAWQNLLFNPSQAPLKRELLERHFLRKHGKNAYYGQRGGEGR